MRSGARQPLSASEMGERLRAARRAAGATQEEIAVRLGMARTTLVAIEAGQRKVAPTELVQLAEAYGRQVSELVRPTALIAAPAAQFRANLARCGAEGAAGAQELERLAADYAELERLLEIPPVGKLPPEYAFASLPASRAGEAAAAAERNRMGLGDGPVGALRQRLADEMGVRVFCFPMASAVAGLFFYHPQLGACIGINASHPPERQRWTLAHELAHLLLSRHEAEVTLLRGGRGGRQTEQMADAFARHFLMPGPGLSRRVSELQAEREGRGLSVADACRLAQLYDVSVQAMVLRLEGLGHVPSGTWDKLIEHGFKSRAAQAALGLARRASAEPPLPGRYVQLAAEGYRLGRLSEGQLARFLRTDRIAARGMVAGIEQIEDEAGGAFTPVSIALGERLC